MISTEEYRAWLRAQEALPLIDVSIEELKEIMLEELEHRSSFY
jgi:hypothetical protein